MADVITLILIITSVVTFLASVILLFFDEKIGLPVGEWVVFIFISCMILLSEIIKQFNPYFDVSSKFLLIAISIAIFVIAVKNYWEVLSGYEIIKRAK